MGHHGVVETTTPATVSAKVQPGWAFHGVVVLAAAGFLYSLSFPGMAYFLAVATIGALFGLAVAWLVLLVVFCASRRRGQNAGRGLRFVIAPLVGALVVVAAWTGAPLDVRWAASRSSFDQAVKAAQSGGTPDRGLFGRVGFYRITSIKAVPNGLLFYEETATGAEDPSTATPPTSSPPSSPAPPDRATGTRRYWAPSRPATPVTSRTVMPPQPAQGRQRGTRLGVLEASKSRGQEPCTPKRGLPIRW